MNATAQRGIICARCSHVFRYEKGGESKPAAMVDVEFCPECKEGVRLRREDLLDYAIRRSKARARQGQRVFK